MCGGFFWRVFVYMICLICYFRLAMIHKKPFEFICLLASFLNVAPAAMAEVNKHISQRYTVEKNAMKCAARLAIDALAESGFANDEMTFFATATASSPAHFILRGTIAVANQTRKVSGAVDLNVTAILNADDSPLQDEVGCGIAGSTFAKIQLKDESNSQSLLTNPLFDAAAGEDKCFFVSRKKGNCSCNSPYFDFKRGARRHRW
jgi:hypothetical protein